MRHCHINDSWHTWIVDATRWHVKKANSLQLRPQRSDMWNCYYVAVPARCVFPRTGRCGNVARSPGGGSSSALHRFSQTRALFEQRALESKALLGNAAMKWPGCFVEQFLYEDTKNVDFLRVEMMMTRDWRESCEGILSYRVAWFNAIEQFNQLGLCRGALYNNLIWFYNWVFASMRLELFCHFKISQRKPLIIFQSPECPTQHRRVFGNVSIFNLGL